jgi:hypothetical protein
MTDPEHRSTVEAEDGMSITAERRAEGTGDVAARFRGWLARVATRVDDDLRSRGDLDDFADVYRVELPAQRASWWLAKEAGVVQVLDDWTGPPPRATVRLSPSAAENIVESRFRFNNMEDAASLAIEGDAGHLFEVRLPYLYADEAHERVLEAFGRAEETYRRDPLVGEILRLHRPHPDLVEELLARYHPAILTGVVGETPAGRWTFELLEARFGQVEVERSLDMTRPLTVADRIHQMRSGDDRTTGGGSLPLEMAGDVDLEPYVSRTDRRFHPLFWMGPAGSRTPLHRDAYFGMSAHLIGRKRWLFYSPDQAELLYPEAGSREAYQRSRVDPLAPDLAHMPRFAQARGHDIVVEPGEILLVPAGWFHDVTALDDAVSVTMSRHDKF